MKTQWQPARLIEVHGRNGDGYLPDETIQAKQGKVVFVRPLNYKLHGWTLAEIRRELDCPNGTRFYLIKGADDDIVCEHECLTD